MKREEIVSKLVKEGFSETTLSKFNDNQLNKFAKKVLKEAQTITTTKTVFTTSNPQDKAAVNALLDKAAHDPSVLKDKNIEVKESGEKKWIQKAVDPKKKGQLHKDLGVPEDEVIPVSKLKAAAKKKGKVGQRARMALNLKKLNEFVDNAVENTYHSLTTKSEMVELVKSKMTNISEKEIVPAIPEFMEEVEVAEPEVAPDTKPDVKPGTDTPPRERPQHPGKRPTTPDKEPLPDDKPKAKAKNISGEEAKSKIIQMVHKIFTGHNG